MPVPPPVIKMVFPLLFMGGLLGSIGYVDGCDRRDRI
jgi:hypothetical protein